MARSEKGRVGRVSNSFTWLLKITVGFFLWWRYRLRTENLEVLRSVRPPYVILPNHVTTWDPFFIGFYAPGPVYNVTSDFQFRRRIMRIVHRLVGSIPKSKVIPDVETIKRILEVRRNKGIIGIYPEGMRTWDGHTADTIFQTAKLLKFLKIPVIATVLKGAYLSLPRWTSRSRRGRVTIEFTKIFSGPELKHLSLEQIQAQIDEALRFDEYEFQQRQMLPYRGNRPAESLELALYVCPHCRSIAQLQSRGHRLRCLHCGYSVFYNEYGFFQRRSGRLYFENVRDWNVWQQAYLEEEIARRLSEEEEGSLLRDEAMELYVGYRVKPVRKKALGDLLLYPDRIEFRASGGATFHFPLNEVDGVNVQLGERLEFYHGRVLHRFVPKGRSVSGLKWMCAVEILRRLNGYAESEAAL